MKYRVFQLPTPLQDWHPRWEGEKPHSEMEPAAPFDSRAEQARTVISKYTKCRQSLFWVSIQDKCLVDVDETICLRPAPFILPLWPVSNQTVNDAIKEVIKWTFSAGWAVLIFTQVIFTACEKKMPQVRNTAWGFKKLYEGSKVEFSPYVRPFISKPSRVTAKWCAKNSLKRTVSYTNVTYIVDLVPLFLVNNNHPPGFRGHSHIT